MINNSETEKFKNILTFFANKNNENINIKHTSNNLYFENQAYSNLFWLFTLRIEQDLKALRINGVDSYFQNEIILKLENTSEITLNDLNNINFDCIDIICSNREGKNIIQGYNNIFDPNYKVKDSDNYVLVELYLRLSIIPIFEQWNKIKSINSCLSDELTKFRNDNLDTQTDVIKKLGDLVKKHKLITISDFSIDAINLNLFINLLVSVIEDSDNRDIIVREFVDFFKSLNQ